MLTVPMRHFVSVVLWDRKSQSIRSDLSPTFAAVAKMGTLEDGDADRLLEEIDALRWERTDLTELDQPQTRQSLDELHDWLCLHESRE